MSDTNEKKYQCPVCGKTFTKPHTVKVHMRLHTGQRPHECHLCSKSFVTASALKDHMISHITSRGFICNRCGAKFKHKGTLKRHQAQHDEYERKRDHGESIETAEVYDSHTSYEQPPAKYFVISAEEAQEKFPYLQDFFSQRSPEINTHEIISADDSDPTVVKQERIVEEDEDAYGATVFEFTEDKFHHERINVKVYNITGKEQEQNEPSSVLPSIPWHSSGKTLLHPKFAGSSKLPVSQKEQEMSPPPDVAARYGSHVSRILRLLDSQEKQAALIKRLNNTLHSFIIKSRK